MVGWRVICQTTSFGAFLDPVADKLMVAVALVLLVEVHATAIIAIPAVVIIGREIVILHSGNGWPSWVNVPVWQFQ